MDGRDGRTRTNGRGRENGGGKGRGGASSLVTVACVTAWSWCLVRWPPARPLPLAAAIFLEPQVASKELWRMADVLRASGLVSAIGKKSRGRPPKKGVGLSKVTHNKYAMEAGIDYVLSMIAAKPAEWAKYASHLKSRTIDIPRQDCRPEPAPKPRPSDVEGNNAENWIRNHLNAVGWDKAPELPLYIKHGAIDLGGRHHRTIWPLRQLELWLKLLASDSVHAKLTAKQGLGIYASKALPNGTEVAAVVVDPFIDAAHAVTLQTNGEHGAWFGPAALVNASCMEHCNAKFARKQVAVDALDEYAVKLCKPVKCQQQILVPYYLDRVAMHCPTCRRLLTQENTDWDRAGSRPP